jgi:dTDP-4-amino-4,6-dideoxygalactose transaminase
MTWSPDRDGPPALEPTKDSADRIPVLRPLLPVAASLAPYLHRIDEGRTYTNWGPLASELEDRLAGHFNLPPACVTSASSGTAALVGAILAVAGRAPLERPLAVVPAFTFVATPLSAEQCAFRAYLVDVDAHTWQIRREALDRHPRLHQVGLVIPVAAFGRAVPQAPWIDFQRETGIPVVIDGGASFEAICGDPGRYLGEIPVVLSFHATKSFSTAEGGCVVTANPRISPLVTQALNFGFFATRDCRAASTNGKMSEYHAAVGLAELDAWPRKRDALRRVANAYRHRLDAFGLAARLVAAPAVAGCYVLFNCAHLSEAGRLLQSLAAANIESRFWYGHGLQRQPYYAGAPRDDLPVTELMAPLAIALPVAPDLPDASIDRVVAAVVGAVCA